MLRDEVPRNAMVLYVFLEDDDSTRADLQVLGESVSGWAAKGIRVMALAPLKLPVLKQLQAELQLPFPLLADDRDFCAQYGVDPEATGRRLVVVNRHCQVAWIADPWTDIVEAITAMKAAGLDKESALTNYPGKVINRLVSWWVN